MLKENSMNWISFAEHLKLSVNNLSEESLEQLVKDFACFIPNSNLTEEEKEYANQSYQAFLAVKRGATVRGDTEVVTESESDNPEDWVHLKGTTAE